MFRIGLMGLLLVFFGVGSLGCGSGSPEVKRGTDPFKARQVTAPAKEKNAGGKFMMPKGVKAPKQE